MDEAKRRLEETRERLGAWKDRLSKRLDEFEKKREVLSQLEARRLARAPTTPIEDLEGDVVETLPLQGQVKAQGREQAPYISPRVASRLHLDEQRMADRTVIVEDSGVSPLDATVVVRAEDVAAALAPRSDASAASEAPPSDESTTPDESSPLDEFPAPAEPPRSAGHQITDETLPRPMPTPFFTSAPTARSRAEAPHGDLAAPVIDRAAPAGDLATPATPGSVEERRGAASFLMPREELATGLQAKAGDGADEERVRASAAEPPRAADTFASYRAVPAAWVDPVIEGMGDLEQRAPAADEERVLSPSLVRRMASLLLDVLFLFLVPSGLIVGPVAWWGIDGNPAAVWTANVGVLLPFLVAVFVLLETLYLGAFGRTPGLRLTGLRVVDASGATPGFGLAFLRALTFPSVVVPPLEAASRTRTTAEA